MFKLGFLDDDTNNRTTFERQFGDAFNLWVFNNLSEVRSLQNLLEKVNAEKLDALAIDYQLSGNGSLQYDGNDVVDYFEKNKKYFPIFIVTSYLSDAVDDIYDVYIVNDKDKVENEEYRKELIEKVKKSIKSYRRRIKDIEDKTICLEKKQRSQEGLTPNEEKELYSLHSEMNKIDPKANPVSAEQLGTSYIKDLRELVKNSRELLNRLS